MVFVVLDLAYQPAIHREHTVREGERTPAPLARRAARTAEDLPCLRHGRGTLAPPPLEELAHVLPRGHHQDRREEAHGQDTRDAEADLSVPDLTLRHRLAGQRRWCVVSEACSNVLHGRDSPPRPCG